MVDWHPFEYYTAHSFENGKHVFTETMRLEPLSNGGTRVHDLLKMISPMPAFMRRMGLKYVLINQHHFDKAIAYAAQLAAEEFSKANSE